MLQMQGTLGIGKTARRTAILIALATTVMMSIWMSAGPVSNANAGGYHFCWYVVADPYGLPYDRCAPPTGTTGLIRAATVSWEHSTCLSTTTAANVLNHPWVCTGGPNTVRWVEFNDGVFRKPIVRNNTTGDVAHIGGIAETW